MKVSLVMIAKDEEANLPTCVGSLEGVYDEFVLVDTGSTDNTIEVARELGAVVYEYPHEEDIVGGVNFSKWRNWAKGKATGDWIVSIDADEWCEETCRANFRKAMEEADDGTDLILVRSYVGAKTLEDIPTMIQWVSKAFRNKPDIEWVGERHNVLNVRTGARAKHEEVVLFHSHKVRAKNANAVRDRSRKTNVDVFLGKLKEDPNDCRSRFYLGNSYREGGKPEKAVEHYYEYLDRSGWGDERSQASIYLADCLVKTGEPEEAAEVLVMSLTDRCDRAEVHLALGDIAHKKGDDVAAVFWYRAAMNCEYPKDSLLFVDPRSYCVVPLRKLAIAFWKRRDYKESFECAFQALEYNPEHRMTRHNLSVALAMTEALVEFHTHVDYEVVRGEVDKLGCDNVLCFGLFDESYDVDDCGCELYNVVGKKTDSATPVWIPKKWYGKQFGCVLMPCIIDANAFLAKVIFNELSVAGATKVLCYTGNPDVAKESAELAGFDVSEVDVSRESMAIHLLTATKVRESSGIPKKRPAFLYNPNSTQLKPVTEPKCELKPRKVQAPAEPRETAVESPVILVVGYDGVKYVNEVLVIDNREGLPDDVFVASGQWLPFADGEFAGFVVKRDVGVPTEELERVAVKSVDEDWLLEEDEDEKSEDGPASLQIAAVKTSSLDVDGREIVIYAGPCWHQYDGATLNGGYLRGSSKACIYLANGLAERGWGVTVYGECEENEVDGVRWKNHRSYKDQKCDVFLSFRRPKVVSTKAQINVFYCHDAGLYGNVEFNDFDLVLAVSGWMKGRFVERYNHGHVEVVPNGVNLNLISRLSGETIRNERKLFHHFAVDRSLLAALRIFQEIREDHDVELEVAGNFDDWIKEAEKRGTDLERARMTMEMVEDGIDGVTFLGPQGEEEVFRGLLSSKACIFPNNVRESFCMSVMEAKACGTPTVASRIQALPETAIPGSILVDGDFNGQVKDYEDGAGTYSEEYVKTFVASCARLLITDLCRKLAEDGIEDASRYGWGEVCDRFIVNVAKLL